jgi:hypothetical protein
MAPKASSVSLPTQVIVLLDKLEVDARGYRIAIGAIFSRKLSRPRDARKCFFALLMRVTELYLDYLLIKAEMPRLWLLSRGAIKDEVPRPWALPCPSAIEGSV